MNKMFAFAATAVLAASMVSCGGGDKTPATFDDSLSTFSGEQAGYQLLQGYASLPKNDRAKIGKDDFLRGFESVIMCDTTDMAYLQGVGMAMQAWQQLAQYEQAGIKIDHKAYFDAFSKAFRNDTIDSKVQAKMVKADSLMGSLGGEAYNRISKLYAAQQEAMMKAQQEEMAQRENAPEAKKALANGKAYIQDQVKKDPTIKTTPSGLAYKVVNPGEGDNIAATDQVVLNYRGTLIDGTEFDKGENAQFSPSSVVPGFGEGLKLMKKGAKYTLYIPGDLAYGVNTPTDKIPANATLIFDVEVLDVMH